MHRISTTPGGWNPQMEGVVFLAQSPAPIVFLTAADTEIQTLATASSQLPPDFPELRVANLLHLQQQLTIDTYSEMVLEKAEVILVRLLGGRSYWAYGLDVLQEVGERTRKPLIILPGDDRPDPDLLSHSTVSLAVAHQLWQYLIEGGSENYQNALKFVAVKFLAQTYSIQPPISIPRIGLYPWNQSSRYQVNSSINSQVKPSQARVGILFYRAHYLSGNISPIDQICQALADHDLDPLPLFVSSLRDPDVQAELLGHLQSKSSENVSLLIDTTSFSISSIADHADHTSPLFSLDIPILQAILSSSTLEQWQVDCQGLSPRDVAMNVALPEMDGRIITRAISFKAVQTWDERLETDVVSYLPVKDRIQFVADLAKNWVKLQRTTISDRRIALILANYPNRNGRLANGVGLDTPNSCIEILQALKQAGYFLEDFPQTGDQLIQQLTSGITNDPEGKALRPIRQSLIFQDFQAYFSGLPNAVQQGVKHRWPDFFSSPEPLTKIPIAGIQLGHIFIGIQPSRGYDLDPSFSYHAPDLEPTPEYLAFYHWLRTCFKADAIVHVGKHGNLEWLPGKSLALSADCYPEVALGALPHFYPFIVNDPGEGSQAKRRSQAVILDHLTPPMTRAELYGSLHDLEGLIDEYYQAQSLNPIRLPLIRERILSLIKTENLHQDLGLSLESLELSPSSLSSLDLNSADSNSSNLSSSMARKLQIKFSNKSPNEPPDKSSSKSFNQLSNQSFNEPHKLSQELEVFNTIDGYLCELKEAQIRDGLHILGQCPQGRQLRDLIVAIARHPDTHRLGLTRAIAEDFNLDFDPLMTNLAEELSPELTLLNQPCRTVGDGVAVIEDYAAALVEEVIQAAMQSAISVFLTPIPGPRTQQELTWIQAQLLPKLQQTNQEISNLLQGLAGHYIPSGASGAPTRGRSDVLPTGRNFYSVDIRAIPTETAWSVGQLAAEALIQRYTQENGEYPKTLGLSVWGTSTMRTGGDDMAEALALLGVKPVWEGASRRVVDFEVLPLAFLGRPRVDVTLRISGFFRDGFPNLIDLFDQAVIAVSQLEETPEQNPLAAQVKQETQTWIEAGLTSEQAVVRSRYRIFGSKPGAYGAGLQGLIEGQNWHDDQDLARAYLNWSCYAYGGSTQSQSFGVSAPEVFEQRLKQLQIVLHNQDNREHDLLDSDDYYQFQGGMTTAVRALTGQNPQIYFGDHSRPESPKVRRLQEEIARVYRSRVVNPKWIAGVMRHGYKGAFEMAATVDYLFAYDVTAHCVEDFMYEGVAQAYLLDEAVQEFVQARNPWALRDMAERLLEAQQRGFWKSATPKLMDQLRAIVHQAEAVVEDSL